MDYLERLQKLEKTINDNKISKAKLEEKRDNLESEYKKIISELETLGIKEEDLVQYITNLEVEIGEEIANCEEQLK